MSDIDDLKLELKRLVLLDELMSTQLELIVNEQAKQLEMLEDIRRQLEPLRPLPALARVIEEQVRQDPPKPR